MTDAAVTLLAGTDKGAFLFRSDPARRNWAIDGPLFKGWKVTSAARDDRGRYLVATASDVYGSALHASDDLRSWRQIEHGPAWPKDGERKLKQIWTLRPAGGDRWYAGVDEAGLFVSEDRGETWSPVDGLNEHPTREGWFPGAGGMCAHEILIDPKDANRIWVGISAVGVFRTDDGGATWHPKNEGVRVVIEDEQHKEIGFCVHGLVADPDDANVIYRREHTGMFRSGDGGESWERCENGLASWFGFPITMDRSTRTLYVVPLESDEYRIPTDGKFRVYRSRDRGDTWNELSNGFPAEHAYMGTLRGAMDVDHLDPCGVYVGTTSGAIYASTDGGDSWTPMDCTLPRVLWVSAFTDGAGLMARVTVELPSLLTAVVDAERTVAVEADSVRAALRAVIDRHPAVEVHVFDETGELREHVLCLHNQANTRWRGTLDAPVADGDVVTILQAVSGG